MRTLLILVTLTVGSAAYAQDPLEALSVSMVKAQSKDAVQVGEFFRGAGPKTDYQVLLEANKCYWFSGTSEGVKKLKLYLWAPNASFFTPRVADAMSDGQATMAYCTPSAGMYKLQVKTEGGKGRFILGIFAKDAPPAVQPVAAAPAPAAPVKRGPELGPICDKTASVAAAGAKRVGEFFEGKGNSIGSADKSDYSVMMKGGKCYWAIGCADPDKVKSLYLYLWGPDNKRITEAKSDNPNPMVGHCAAANGMYKIQAKMNSGNGTYKVGLYEK